MSYIVTRSFYEGNTLHEEGGTFEHQNQEYVQKCLADGNIADSQDENAQAKAAEAAKRAEVEAANAAENEARQQAFERANTSEVTTQQPPLEQPTSEQLERDFNQTGAVGSQEV